MSTNAKPFAPAAPHDHARALRQPTPVVAALGSRVASRRVEVAL